MDLHPTFARMVGQSMPTDRVIDGKDIGPILLGKPGAKTPHDRFFYQQGGRLAAVRAGNWKLMVNGELYNLKSDLAEKKKRRPGQSDCGEKTAGTAKRVSQRFSKELSSSGTRQETLARWFQDQGSREKRLFARHST